MQLSLATDSASRTKRHIKAYLPMTAFANTTANYELQSVIRITMPRRADILTIGFGLHTLGALQRVYFASFNSIVQTTPRRLSALFDQSV